MQIYLKYYTLQLY